MMSVVSSSPSSLERGPDSRQVVVGVADGGERGRAVDAGDERIEAVGLEVLGAVGIARPEHQHERLVALLEHGQDRARGHGGEIVLLHDVGDGGAGVVAAGAARRRRERQAYRLEALGHLGRQRNALGAAGRVVDDDRLRAGALGVIENQGRTELADGGGAVALVAG